MKLIDTNYINKRDKELVEEFISSPSRKKFILGINRLTKSVQKYIQVDGIIDDFTRVQNSKKKTIYKIADVPKDALILATSMGSPLEVKNELDNKGFENINYLSFFKYVKNQKLNFDLAKPPFICDFEEDFKNNYKKYEETYALLSDEKSKEVFTKVINFKISFDLNFMQGFTNNHEEQYFDKEIIPKIENINFVDGGAYIGDTIPNIIKNFPDFKKIYCIEPNDLHISIAKKNFSSEENIEFINFGLGSKEIIATKEQEINDNCSHDYQAENIKSLDSLIHEKVDFIKLDIEGAEEDAIKGAKNIIEKYHPILAICIYHKAEDWYKIPKLVLEIRNDYAIYLRHYMEGIYETVMYFIPKKSLLLNF